MIVWLLKLPLLICAVIAFMVDWKLGVLALVIGVGLTPLCMKYGGKVKQKNQALGIIQFCAKAGLSNLVKMSVSIAEQDGVSNVRIAASCSDGVVGLNSVGRVYDKFVKCLSAVEGGK